MTETLQSLQKKALLAAKEADWNQAIDMNQLILKQKPKDTATLNRLARAYMEIGQKNKAVCAYKKVLEIDKYNQIAERNFKKLNCNTKIKKGPHQKLAAATAFIEEKGKTKVIRLIRPATTDLIETLHFAEELHLVSKRKTVIIKDCTDRYIGALPDDIGFRLNRLIQKGNQYEAWVKNAENQEVIIFIREVHQAPESNQVPSFN